MANESTKKLEKLRQAVLGNQRGREVEVEPTGEIRISDEAENGGRNDSHNRSHKPSKMADHTFGS